LAVGFAAKVTEEKTALYMEAFTRLQDLARQPSIRMAIKVKGRILLINPSDVVAVLAEGNYVSLQQESISYLLRESISVVAEHLEPFGFIRIHRSALVNTTFVEEIKRYSTGEYGLRVRGGKEYTVTRTYKENLKFLAEFWIPASSARSLFADGGKWGRGRIRSCDKGSD
jgi:two-component system LytT family response regulator